MWTYAFVSLDKYWDWNCWVTCNNMANFLRAANLFSKASVPYSFVSSIVGERRLLNSLQHGEPLDRAPSCRVHIRSPWPSAAHQGTQSTTTECMSECTLLSLFG